MNKQIASVLVFLALFYVALWIGSTIVLNVQADPMTVTILGVVVPGTILWFIWTRYGKKLTAAVD